MRFSFLLCPLLMLCILLEIRISNACNKALCASDVSKCLLQGLCQCQPSEESCPCCKECMLCLASLWEECCDCVGMCSPRNYSYSSPTSRSTVEDLQHPIPSLFRALTEGDAPLNMMVVSFPITEELSHHDNLASFLETLEQQHQRALHQAGSGIHGNYDKDGMCTVVYFAECMSVQQCKQYCESVGARRLRWFHNACCQCIGPECLHYGSTEVKCTNCLV